MVVQGMVSLFVEVAEEKGGTVLVRLREGSTWGPNSCWRGLPTKVLEGR